MAQVKFGGDGTGKEACVNRRCRNLKDRDLSSKKRGFEADEDGDMILTGKRRRVQKESIDADDGSPQMLRTSKISPKINANFLPKPPVKKAKVVMDQLYGRPLPKNSSDVCAGCLGTRNVELQYEPILLCDGPGCNSEYHLQCCLPETTEVPNDEYFCIDCTPTGSSSGLGEYLEKVDEHRANYENSYAFVEAQLQEGMNVTKIEDENQDSAAKDGIPVSEIDRLSQLHHDAVADLSADSADSVPQTPDFLIGKPLRIYCPIGNLYHSGRIVDWRKAGHCDKFWGSTEIGQCEFLVRFPAGKDGRKVPYRAWIILEEHSCAVGVSMVWAVQKRATKPAMTWLRTSLEILPVRSQLDEGLHQIYTIDGEPYDRDHQSWCLVNILGDDKEYALLSLRDEAFRFNHTGCCQGSTKEKEMLIMRALAEVELQEQDRARAWHKLRLENKLHTNALTIADENALAPIDFKNSADFEGPLPVQLLPDGLDRAWLIEQLGEEDTSKDHLVGIRCQLVQPGPSHIKHYFELARGELFAERRREAGAS